MEFAQIDKDVLCFLLDCSGLCPSYTNENISYLEILAKLHKLLKPKSYLEIGVNDGNSFNLVDPGCIAHGVDPLPRTQANHQNHLIIKKTSDDYFLSEATLKPELTFIDGLHTAEQATKDLINTYNDIEIGSTIVIDDILPQSILHCQVFRCHSLWHGDVYKVILFLRYFYPELNVCIFNCQPGGLALINKRSNARMEYHADEINSFFSAVSSVKFMLSRDSLLKPKTFSEEVLSQIVGS